MAEIFKSEAGRDLIMGQYAEILAAWPVSNRQFHVETRHGSTFVIESGRADHPPLLLLHGSVSNSFSWIGDIETLSATRHVFAIDIIGEAGLSDPNRPAYDSGAYAEWLADLLDALEIERCALVGLSLGGWMALSFAVAQPQRVERLSLICPGGICAERVSFLIKAIAYAFLGSWGKQRTLRLVGADMLAGPAEDDTPAEKQGIARQGMEKAIAFSGLIGQHFRPRMGKLLQFSDAELRSLTMPVQVIFGEFDKLLRAQESIERLGRLAANVQATLLPHTGHLVVNQTQRIQTFLEG